MNANRNCPDCQVAMDEGFVPDFATNSIIQMLWHPGKAEAATVLGVRTGSVKLDRTKYEPLAAFRCPDCGLVRFYT